MIKKYILGLLVISVLQIDNAISVGQLGHLQPSGTIRRTKGDTIEITCTLDDLKNYTIDDLELIYNRKSLKTEIMTISNSTKMLRIVNAPIMEINVDCVVNRMGADRTVINVGTKPENVINFKCMSYNWENLTCTFERPFNPVAVNYTLYYTSHNGEKVFKTPVNICNLKPNFNRIYTCFIGFQSESPYRQSYDYYFFRLIGENEFGKITEDFTIDHFNIVVPNPPENVNATNITSNSVVLNWKISTILQHFPKQFVYKINYMIGIQNKNEDREWIQLGPFTEPSKHERELSNRMSHALRDLPYANTLYDCRVFLKVKDADDTAEMWSNYSYHVFRTESRIPDKPPLTDIGSFSITDSGHIFIYWKELPKFELNGPDFKYIIVGANNTNFVSMRTLIKLEHIDANVLTEPLSFHIYSQNRIGKSINNSVVHIPAAADRCEPPTPIKKIRLDNETYNISWVAPIRCPKIASYTVFWCEPNNESPTDCKGSIDFETVSADVLSYRLKTNNSMNFAISANSETSSSGMVWAMCTVLPGNEINKLTSIITVRVQSTSIEFKWSLACVDRTILTGYILEYCEIKDPKTGECKEPPQSHNLTAIPNEYKLEHLKPYTTYSVRIRMISENSIGPWSEPQVNTTLEAAPTPPLNLRQHNVTNTTVELTWDVPKVINGALKVYKVSYNGKTVSAEINQGTPMQPFLLTGLQSFTEYEVVVQACTGHCSTPSIPIIFNTTIGYPGVIQQPKVKNWQLLTWEPPAVAGGHLEYYEVLVVYTNNGRQERTIQINGTQCHFTKDFHDILNEGQFDYSVRAVNVLQSSHYKGHFIHKTKRDLAEKYIDLESDHSKSESNVLKRHSKPEIDNESKGYNFSPKDDAIRKHNEHEPHHESNERIYNHYGGMSSTDLSHIKICEEENDPQLQDYLKADKWPTLFKGPYSVSFTHQTHFNSSGYLYLIVLLIVFTMAFVYATFFGFKKLKRMKDIGVELPEGLEDIKEESKAKHLDGGITRDELGRTLDYRTNNEQENDPLVRFRMESASTSSIESNSQSEYNEGMDNSIDYEQNTEDDSAQSGTDNHNTQHKKSPPTPLIPMQQSEPGIIQNPTPPSPLLQMSSETHHLYDSHMGQLNHFNPRPLIQPNALPPLTSNGYVTHDAIIGKPVISSGYTPWSAIDARKRTEPPNSAQTDDMKTKTPIITSTDLQGISGYVTHKQLSDFGQLMH